MSRCFPDNSHDMVFVNAHWEYSRNDPDKHYAHGADWERGYVMLNKIVTDFQKMVKR